ncbi:MAG TPA: SMC-Scp complex subunit ScpB, partial [Candidatus Nanopelagicales bacterium]|nr:SMC-Scp complex subunit ScpB [Candidatus Nanopelagicales bacterium]
GAGVNDQDGPGAPEQHPGTAKAAEALAEPQQAPDGLSDGSEPATPSTGGAEDVASAAEPDGTDLSDEADDSLGAPSLEAALEAVLLVTDQPLDVASLAALVRRPAAEVAACLQGLVADYASAGRGFELREVAGGWRFYTRADCAEVVERYVRDGQQARLTQAALETLAVVAYRQPVARARISAVRGVNVDGVIRTLTSRGLIAEAGHEEHSGAILYRTTELFLERLGIRGLEDLPPVADYLPDIELLDEFIDNTSSGD